MTDAEQLKPCPHCGTSDHLCVMRSGSAASGYYPYIVHCNHLDCDDVRGPTGNGRYEAIAAWNRRPNPSGDADVREKLTRAALHDADDISGRIAAGGYRANLSDVECLRNHVRRLSAALTENASTDRAGKQACKAEVSPNLQTPAPQGGGEADAIERLTQDIYHWELPFSTIMPPSRRPAKETSSDIRRLIAAVQSAALKPQTPDVLGEATATDDLVDRFAAALKEKLRAAEAKYGHNNGWMRDDWRDDLIRDLARHVQKGDPRDVAAYCAFAWHHGWPTATPSLDVLGGEGVALIVADVEAAAIALHRRAQGVYREEHDHFPLKNTWEGLDDVLRDGWRSMAETVLRLAVPVTDWSDVEDDLSDVIGDSIDMDWTSRDGAKAVVRWLRSYRLAARPSQ